MSEADAVAAVDEPVTVDSLTEDLRALGVRPGETLLVHSSLRALGWVAGGAQAVVDALRRAVGEAGTVVVPTFTGQYGDPAEWSNPPVPDDWVPWIRASMPAYRPAVTPSRGVGVVPECLRTYPDAVRSRHPVVSFAALGDAAVVADHGYDDPLGEGSPLAAIYERDGRVLRLGTGHAANTSLHLAEHRAGVGADRVTNVAPVVVDGERDGPRVRGARDPDRRLPRGRRGLRARGRGRVGPGRRGDGDAVAPARARRLRGRVVRGPPVSRPLRPSGHGVGRPPAVGRRR